MKIFKSGLKSIFLHGSESLHTTTKDVKVVQAFINHSKLRVGVIIPIELLRLRTNQTSN